MEDDAAELAAACPLQLPVLPHLEAPAHLPRVRVPANRVLQRVAAAIEVAAEDAVAHDGSTAAQQAKTAINDCDSCTWSDMTEHLRRHHLRDDAQEAQHRCRRHPGQCDQCLVCARRPISRTRANVEPAVHHAHLPAVDEEAASMARSCPNNLTLFKMVEFVYWTNS